MTIAWSENINKDDTYIIKFVKKNPQTLRYSFNRGNSNSEILYRSVCDTETFNGQTQYTWIISIQFSTPCNCFISIPMWYGTVLFLLHLYLIWGVVQCEDCFWSGYLDIWYFINSMYLVTVIFASFIVWNTQHHFCIGKCSLFILIFF